MPENLLMVRNAVLRALPTAELERLRPYLRQVPLTRGAQLLNAGEGLDGVVFIEEGAVSRLIQLPGGESVEAGIVGSEGFIGLPLVFGRDRAIGSARVQIPGSAFLLSAADFEGQVQSAGSPLLRAMFGYANLLVEVLGRLTLCHCLHRIEQRICRCLLMLHDRSTNDELRITHDTLAEFLGVHRPSVTYALQRITEDGSIGIERRRIRIRNRAAIEARACECYEAIRNATSRETELFSRDGRGRTSAAS